MHGICSVLCVLSFVVANTGASDWIRCLEIYGEIHPFFNLKLLLMFISSIFVTKTLPHALLISFSVIMSASLDCYFVIKVHCMKNVSLSFHLPLLSIQLLYCLISNKFFFIFCIIHSFFHAICPHSLDWSEHLVEWCVYFNERTPILLINTTIDLFTHQINCLLSIGLLIFRHGKFHFWIAQFRQIIIIMI